jgi:hypothetical protein
MSFDSVGWPEGMAQVLAFLGAFAAVAAGAFAPAVAAIAGLILGRSWYRARNDLKGTAAMLTLGAGIGLMAGSLVAANPLLTGGLLALGIAGGWAVHAAGIVPA